MDYEVVIDEEGEIKSACGFHFGSPDSSGSSLEETVCRLGLVLVRPLRHGLQVYFRPDAVAAAAVVRLAYVIGDNNKSVTVLSTWVDGGFRHKIAPSGKRALGLLIECSPRSCSAREVPLRRLAIGRDKLPPSLRACVDVWSVGGEDADPGHLLSAMQRLTDDRFVAFERIEGSPRFVLRGYGRKNPAHAMRWYEGNLGRPLRSDDLDLAYHWFCNGAYRDAIALRHPLCEIVQARVQVPNSRPILRRYNRIILPIRRRRSELVLVATQPHGTD